MENQIKSNFEKMELARGMSPDLHKITAGFERTSRIEFGEILILNKFEIQLPGRLNRPNMTPK